MLTGDDENDDKTRSLGKRELPPPEVQIRGFSECRPSYSWDLHYPWDPVHLEGFRLRGQEIHRWEAVRHPLHLVVGEIPRTLQTRRLLSVAFYKHYPMMLSTNIEATNAQSLIRVCWKNSRTAFFCLLEDTVSP